MIIFDCLSKILMCEKNGSLGANVHHEQVWTKFLQRPEKVLAIRMLSHESKKIEITLRIAHYAVEIVNLKQAQITMIVLDALLLELGTFLRCKLVGFPFCPGAGRLFLMIL